jgi:hypothetical protein
LSSVERALLLLLMMMMHARVADALRTAPLNAARPMPARALPRA